MSVHTAKLALVAPVALCAQPASSQPNYPDIDVLRAVERMDRQSTGRSQDWQYAMALVTAAGRAGAIERSAGGDKARAAALLRGRLYYVAARQVMAWQDRWYPRAPGTDRFSPNYAYASLLVGLLLEYSGDHWLARTYLGYAFNQSQRLTIGSPEPKYNGKPLSQVAQTELTAVNAILSREGDGHPADRKSSFQMSQTNGFAKHAAAIEYDLAHGADDPALLQAPTATIPAREPE